MNEAGGFEQVKVAAYQCPFPLAAVPDTVGMIAQVVRRCESAGVAMLCCPEGVLGGLADDAVDPAGAALTQADLAGVLELSASATVTTIIGFTELGGDGRLYNSAAVVTDGAITGLYRKRQPARRASVYHPGSESPVFTAAGLRFGILICNDTNHPDLAVDLVGRGAQALFVPSNNALRHDKADVVAATRDADTGMARRHGVPVVRADVAGTDATRTAHGTSAIVAAGGVVIATGRTGAEDLLIAEIEVPARSRDAPEVPES